MERTCRKDIAYLDFTSAESSTEKSPPIANYPTTKFDLAANLKTAKAVLRLALIIKVASNDALLGGHRQRLSSARPKDTPSAIASRPHPRKTIGDARAGGTSVLRRAIRPWIFRSVNAPPVGDALEARPNNEPVRRSHSIMVRSPVVSGCPASQKRDDLTLRGSDPTPSRDATDHK